MQENANANPPSSTRASLWGLAVALLYVLILVVVMLPVATAAFVDDGLRRGKDILDAAREPAMYYVNALFIPEDCLFLYPWGFVLVLLLAQLTLLTLPVRQVRIEPVRKRHLIFPILGTAATMSLLVMGIAFSLYETAFGGGDPSLPDSLRGWLAASPWILLGLSWVFFLLLFGAFARCERRDWLQVTLGWLLRGSALELLVAVPCHVVARWRNYCCAGFMTFAGLTCGLAVMLFAFGPGVFFLFHKRWVEKTRGQRGA